MLFRSRAVRAVLVVDDGKYHAMSAIDLGFIDDDSQRRSEGGPRKEGKEVVGGGRDWTTGTNSRRSPEKDERSFSKRTPPVLFLDSHFLPTLWVECDGRLRACEGVPRNGAPGGHHHRSKFVLSSPSKCFIVGENEQIRWSGA